MAKEENYSDVLFPESDSENSNTFTDDNRNWWYEPSIEELKEETKYYLDFVWKNVDNNK